MRVLKWTVPVDDAPHKIGGGPVAHVDCQFRGEVNRGGEYVRTDHFVQVWTIEGDAEQVPTPRHVQVYGTGMYLPEVGGEANGHVGSCLDGQLVWHVFTVDDDRWHR